MAAAINFDELFFLGASALVDFQSHGNGNNTIMSTMDHKQWLLNLRDEFDALPPLR